MSDPNQSRLPERVILRLLRLGVEALTANPSEIDRILGNDLEDASEVSKARAAWEDQPPRVVLGYPRDTTYLPCFAVTLGSDRTDTEFVGLGDESWLDDVDDVIGNRFKRRNSSSFAIYIYTMHPDMAAWYYRLCREIVNVGSQYLSSQGLDDPMLDGAELVPEARQEADHVFVRRLTLTVSYCEEWTDQGPLWEALNGPGFPAGTATTIEVHHEDIPGGVVPYME